LEKEMGPLNPLGNDDTCDDFVKKLMARFKPSGAINV